MGYQQMQEVFIGLTTTGNVIMDQSIPGITGGEANGSSTFTVVTDSPSGYQHNRDKTILLCKTLPIVLPITMRELTDYSFTVGAGEAYFDTPEGIDITQFFQRRRRYL